MNIHQRIADKRRNLNKKEELIKYYPFVTI